MSKKKVSANDKFREYVTSTAFSMSLSQPQIQLLMALRYDDGSRSYLGRFSHYIVSLRCLVERGLVLLIPMVAKAGDGSHFREGAQYNKIEVSPAGVKMVELLELAGFTEDRAFGSRFRKATA